MLLGLVGFPTCVDKMLVVLEAILIFLKALSTWETMESIMHTFEVKRCQGVSQQCQVSPIVADQRHCHTESTAWSRHPPEPELKTPETEWHDNAKR